jgi:hypothetical protein
MLAPDNLLVLVFVVRRGQLKVSDARAGRAHAARFDAASRATVKRTRKLKREVLLAQAILADEQQRAGNATLLQHPAQSLLRALIPDKSVKHKWYMKV